MNQRILGVDPGTVRLGYGVVRSTGGRPEFLGAGTCSAPAHWTVARRLGRIQAELREVAERYQPVCVVVESSYHGKNSQALIRLGEARGMVIGLALQLGMEVQDYSPAMIKKAVTGRGNSGKDLVARMVRALLPGVPEHSGRDATDALAAALCHCHRRKLPARSAPARSLQEDSRP